MRLDIKCPSYSVLSKRLSSLGIKSPRYAKSAVTENDISTIAIDSAGLKRFDSDEGTLDNLIEQFDINADHISLMVNTIVLMYKKN